MRKRYGMRKIQFFEINFKNFECNFSMEGEMNNNP